MIAVTIIWTLLVSAQGTPVLKVNDFNSSINHSVLLQAGTAAVLLCTNDDDNPYTDELMKLILPNSSVILGSTLTTASLTFLHSGNYSCISPEPENSAAYLYIDVAYPPYQDKRVLCSWVINVPGLCEVKFFSNPPSHFDDLSKIGETYAEGWKKLYRNSEEHILRYRRNKVMPTDNGTYSLTVKSLAHPYTHAIEFDVIVIGATDEKSATTSPLVSVVSITICCVVLDIIIIILIVLIVKDQLLEDPDADYFAEVCKATLLPDDPTLGMKKIGSSKHR